MIKNVLFLGILGLIILGCNHQSSAKKDLSGVQQPDSVYVPKYANRFSIKYYSDHKIVEVLHPWDSLAAPLSMVLSGNEAFLKRNPDAIRVPVKRWISVASTQICYANHLGVLDQLVGMAEPEYVSNEKVKKGIEKSLIRNIGTAYAPDMEVVLSLNPDMMMISPFRDDYYGPLRNAGIKVATNSSYLENTPLGRMEWLMFVASFFDREDFALKKVQEIADKYNAIKEIASQANDKPDVFTGKVYQGVWYVPAAQSYKAVFLKDAGVNYIFNDRPGVGSHNYDFETVYEAAGDCKFWSILVNYPGTYSYSALKTEDTRYADFTAFKERNVIFSNTNSSRYYEEGIMCPEVILSDMVKMYHPELLKNYEPVFYKRLTKE